MKLLLAATLAASGVAVFPNLLDPYTLPKLAALAAGLGVFWGLRFWRGVRDIPLPPLFFPALGILGAMCLSALFSADKQGVWLGASQLHAYGLAPFFAYFSFYCAVSAADENGDSAHFDWALVAVAAALGLSALAQVFFAAPAPGLSAAPLEGGRALSLFGSPVYFGAVSALAAPFVAERALRERGAVRSLAAVACLFLIAALWLSRSRGAWLACAAGLGVWSALGGAAARRRYWAPAAVLLALCAAGGVLTVRKVAASDAARAALWGATLRMARAQPLLGAGPGSFEHAFPRYAGERFIKTHGRAHTQAHAHNGPLNALATGGVLELLLWIILCAVLLRRARGVFSARSAPAAGALAAAFLQAQVNPMPVAAWLIAALAAARLIPVRAETRRLPGAVPIAFFVLSLATLMSAAKALSADRLYRQAREAAHRHDASQALAYYDRAARAAPWRARLSRERVAALLAVAQYAPNPETRRRFAQRALSAAQEGLRGRPAAAGSWHAMGAALMAAEENNAEIKKVFEKGAEIQWYYPGLLESRIKAASRAGDAAEAARLRAALERLSALK